MLESHPRVLAYAKNQGMQFEVPYRDGAIPRRYVPDFLVRLDDGRDDPLTLILETKGYRGGDAQLKAETMRTLWVPGFNNSGGFGRWAFEEFRDVFAIEESFAKLVNDLLPSPSPHGGGRRKILMAKEPKTRRVETLVHDKARRKNIPTAELQTFLDAEEDAKQFGSVSYARARPLAEGETRARDEDRDPQLIWNGVRIRLTQGQVRQLAETGEVAIGDAQLVWRGKDTQDWSDLIVQAPPLYIQEKIHPKAIIDDLQKHSSPPSWGRCRRHRRRGATRPLRRFQRGGAGGAG